jgi:phosphoribosylformylglycinamidine synthase PurS subunit
VPPAASKPCPARGRPAYARHILEGLGFSGVNDVRAGKLIELDLADGVSDEDVEAMCRKLLANTVIENFRIERPEGAAAAQ